MKQASIISLSALLLFSCAPATQVSQTQVITVYATSAAQPWLTELYGCAANSGVVLNVNADAPDIYLRLGEPDVFITSTYQIDDEEILIITPRDGPVQNLTLEEAQELFAQGDASTQVWVYSSDADVQMVFDQLVMKGRPVTSSANLAVSPQSMFDVLSSEPAAIGILPRNWVTGNVREVYSLGRVPVLAVTKEEPQGVVIDLVSCLQSK